MAPRSPTDYDADGNAVFDASGKPVLVPGKVDA
jgi:hypothetical protein